MRQLADFNRRRSYRAAIFEDAMRLDLWGIKLATLALAIGGCGVVQGHEGVANMTIYYVPFGVETLTPITSTNIQERGDVAKFTALKI